MRPRDPEQFGTEEFLFEWLGSAVYVCTLFASMSTGSLCMSSRSGKVASPSKFQAVNEWHIFEEMVRIFTVHEKEELGIVVATIGFILRLR